MSINSTNRYTYSVLAADTTNPSVPYNFKVSAKAEVGLLYRRGNAIAEISASNFSLTDVGNALGGSVNITGDYLDEDEFLAYLITAETQGISYQYLDAFDRSKNESAIDYLTNLCKRLLNEVDRCIKLPKWEINKLSELDVVRELRPGKYVVFNTFGDPVIGDPDGLGLSVVGKAVSQSVAASGTPDVSDITIGEDKTGWMTVLVDIEGRGYARKREFVLKNIGGTLAVEAAGTRVSDDDSLDSDTVDVTCVVSGSVFDLNINGSGLSATRTVNCRFKIETFDNSNEISFT